MQKILIACRNTDQGCRNPKDFALETTKCKIFCIMRGRIKRLACSLSLTHKLASTAPADSDAFLTISKDFALRQSNAKDFDRGCRNPKSFAFVAYTSKIFSIVIARD
jgi:hypothetical protein